MFKEFDPFFLDEIKSHAQDLGMHFLQVAGNGKSIACPFCNNGIQGDSGTGVTFNSDGVTHCFVCGKSFNIFQAVMNVKHCSFPEAVKLCAEFLGIQVTYENDIKTAANEKIFPLKTVEKKLDKSISILSDYYKTCTDNLFHSNKAIDYLSSRSLFDEQLIKDFRIGYDTDINCIVIPHDDYYCTRRAITDDKKLRFIHNLKGVSISIFNATCLASSEVVFITEGAIDALSIIRAGGNAIALGGAGNSKLIAKLFKNGDHIPAFIILTDDDKAGQQSASAISKELLKIGCYFERKILPDKLDANDWLVKDFLFLKDFVNKTSSIVKIKMSLDRSSKGNKFRANTHNFKLILENDPLIKGSFGYDSFKEIPTRLKKFSWTDTNLAVDSWQDVDDSSVQNYIDLTYGIRNMTVFNSVITELFHLNSFHPVRDYLNSLPEWDGVERAETFFINALSVEDSLYSRTVSVKWLLAAVVRVMHPASKFDYCLVFKGEQGIGKSTVVKNLGVDWFNDSISNIDNKDGVEGLLGRWIIELGEMQATKKADNEAIKAFISRTEDIIRLPYNKRKESFPRQCVFCATTNNEEFLKDRTGARRFWILVCNATIDTTKERLDKINSHFIDQLWAEVLHNYYQLNLNVAIGGELKNSQFLDIPADVRKIAIELQAKHTEGSELAGMVEHFCNEPVPYIPYWYKLSLNARRKFFMEGYTTISRDVLIHIRNMKTLPSNVKERVDNDLLHMGSLNELKLLPETVRTKICAAEIANELLKIDNPAKDRRTINEINEILARLPDWEQVIGTVGIFNVYGRQRISFNRKRKKVM